MSAHNHPGRVCDRQCPAWDHKAARRDLTPPDDLLKRAKELNSQDDGYNAAHDELNALVPDLIAALESDRADRALLRRIVEAWDVQNACCACGAQLMVVEERETCEDCVCSDDAPPWSGFEAAIDEARARIGEGK